jgi:hypothetical protein
MTGFDVHAADRPSVRLWRCSADSCRSQDRDGTAGFDPKCHSGHAG